MIIAHFSDLHLQALDEEYDWVLSMVDDAAERGADHLVITGDLVDAAQLRVAESLIKDISERGYGSGSKLSIVPGNHDIFPVTFPPSLSIPHGFRPQKNFEWFCEATKPSRRGRSCRQLFRGHPYPFGKELSRKVVLAGLDTTRSETANLLKWASGEMDGNDIDAIGEFFDEHPNAVHKILLLHHYPFRDFDHYSFAPEMEFVDPEPTVARNWIRWTGATLILCGHIHAFGRWKVLSRDCYLNCADSDINHYEDGTTGRTYTLITLDDDGGVEAEDIPIDEEDE